MLHPLAAVAAFVDLPPVPSHGAPAGIAARCPSRRDIAAAALLVFVVASTAPTAAMMIRRLTLPEMVDHASVVVLGTVRDVRSGRDAAGLPATWVSLTVTRTVKGPSRSELTFKQFGAAEPLGDGTLARVPGLPRYHPGDEVVLLLDRESSAGFTSPIGLEQGVFHVRRHGGRASVRNDMTSPGTSTTGAPPPPPATDVPDADLDAFLDVLARLAHAPHR